MSVFEIVRGVEGDCLVLDGTRICGPKPWGGGRIIKTFHTDGIYEVIDKDEYHKLRAENARLRELAEKAWKAAEMLCQAWDGPCRADGVSIKPPCPLDERDEECVYGLLQRELRELGVEVDK